MFSYNILGCSYNIWLFRINVRSFRIIVWSFLVGATTPQEANVSEDIPDWREPVDRSSAPVSLDRLDIVTEG